MEDRHRADIDLRGDPQMAFFDIFDGHGGAKAVRTGYLKTDAEFSKEEARGGTCCVTAFLTKGDLVVSNAGDCTAVLSSVGTVEALTSDHRPSREDEGDRIERLGGYVDFCRGVWRLQGSLAVSRGIRDSHLKRWVIPELETKILDSSL